MTSISLQNLGDYRAFENSEIIVGRHTKRNASRRAIVFCHGVSQNARGWQGDKISDKIYALTHAGYPVISADLSLATFEGANWGNSDHRSAIMAALAYIRSEGWASSSPAGLLGASMGACGALTTAKANLSSFFAVAGMIPVISLDKVYLDPLWGPGHWKNIARSQAIGFTDVATSVDTTGAAFTGGTGVLTVDSTANFTAPGFLRVCHTLPDPDTAGTLSYAGIIGNAFTGCTRLTGGGVLQVGDPVVKRDLPNNAANSPVNFGATDLAGLPVKLWCGGLDPIAATPAEANAWDGAGSNKSVQSLGFIGHDSGAVNPSQVLDFFDTNGGRS